MTVGQLLVANILEDSAGSSDGRLESALLVGRCEMLEAGKCARTAMKGSMAAICESVGRMCDGNNRLGVTVCEDFGTPLT